jgi:hypothetical protein
MATSGSLELSDLTVHDAYFEPMVEILPTESRATISPLCRQDYPLSSPINMSGFHGLIMKEIGSKVGKKPALTLGFCHFSLSLPLPPPPSIILATNRRHQ